MECRVWNFLPVLKIYLFIELIKWQKNNFWLTNFGYNKKLTIKKSFNNVRVYAIILFWESESLQKLFYYLKLILKS